MIDVKKLADFVQILFVENFKSMDTEFLRSHPSVVLKRTLSPKVYMSDLGLCRNHAAAEKCYGLKSKLLHGN